MTHQNVTLRMPVELVEQIDAEAARQSKELNLRVDRSQIIRQALAKALEKKDDKKGGAK